MADYLKGSLQNYLDAAASGEPTPGGGSASALAGALGAAMAAMAANFTVGKKQFAAVEPEVKQLLDQIESARRRLESNVQKDTEVYAGVSEAYQMPKVSPAEKAARKLAISEACRAAAAVPLDVLRACREAMIAARRLAELANPNLITDVGVAALLLEAAAGGAALNVAVNVPAIGDPEFAGKVGAEISAAIAECTQLSKEAQDVVSAKLARGAK